jgi:Stage II sporulation protein E (SpoIIE)
MSPLARVLSLCAFAACERAEPPPAPEPPPTPVHDRAHAKIRYAAKTQPAFSGINNNYFSIVEDAALFLVADANDPAASRLVAEAMGVYPQTECAPRVDPDERAMWCGIERANRDLRAAKQTSSFAAVIVRDGAALVATAGDVPIYVRNGATGGLVGVRTVPALGTDPTAQADVKWIPLAIGDSLVIVDRGLLAALGLDRLRAAAAPTVAAKVDLETAVSTLVDAGMPLRDHAELTAVEIYLAPQTP